MSYGWIIDRVNSEFLEDDEVGTFGPSGISEELHDMLVNTSYGKIFRMYDDDGIWYYTGRIVGEYDGEEPLEDFGMPNAGCTDITFSRKEMVPA